MCPICQISTLSIIFINSKIVLSELIEKLISKLLGKKIILAKYIPTIFKQINLEILEGNFELRRLNYFKDFLEKSGVDHVHYLEILNEKNLSKLTKIPSISRIFIAISISGVRLIDNMRIESKLACSKDGQIKIYKDKFYIFLIGI